jgi:hypothetical protein
MMKLRKQVGRAIYLLGYVICKAGVKTMGTDWDEFHAWYVKSAAAALGWAETPAAAQVVTLEDKG